ncbi:hypothetical protein Y1Q_0003794 [Alligator mississippiensis]|uniref:ribonuclease H n=1 Tax=Alligator mississippiensis TaxID=8496 RepID=A0A151MNB5_ALLMI|nr:hypothetical protein Y1Q_0003794 [Alligator mississippiensis]
MVADALIKVFCQLGFPSEILTDRGGNFMAEVMKCLWDCCGVEHLKTTAYHPQTNVLVERFSGTLKGMLKAYVDSNPNDWHEKLLHLLFAYREVPQESTGFSPFELMFGRRVRGPLDLVKEEWEGKIPSTKTSVVEQAAWEGPHAILDRLDEMTYVVAIRDRKPKTVHVNMLKSYYDRKEMVFWVPSIEGTLEDPEEPVMYGDWDGEAGIEELCLPDHLPSQDKDQLLAALQDFETVFSNKPGKTDLAVHSIDTGSHCPIYSRHYPVNEKVRQERKREITEMEELEVIRPSTSPWASPVVLVQKQDGTIRFCVDYRKLNAITTPDLYPMPTMGTLLDRLGPAKVISTLGLSKGFWQIALDPDAIAKSAFTTPIGLYEFTVLPFAPLHKLTKKGILDPVVWKQGYQEAFDSPKAALVKQPILKAPLHDKPFYVATDASDIGLGAVLLQEHQETWHPVVYGAEPVLHREGVLGNCLGPEQAEALFMGTIVHCPVGPCLTAVVGDHAKH